ncbi:unnamed protein product, partial [Ectocarpus sp. 4 AP-2014]
VPSPAYSTAVPGPWRQHLRYLHPPSLQFPPHPVPRPRAHSSPSATAAAATVPCPARRATAVLETAHERLRDFHGGDPAGPYLSQAEGAVAGPGQPVHGQA